MSNHSDRKEIVAAPVQSGITIIHGVEVKDRTAKPLIQMAPVKGVTDRTFRIAFVRHFGGIDSVLAPFVTRSDNDSKFRSLAPELNPGIRTVPQILTRSPEDFILLSDKLHDLGCDEVNWNLGCPFAMVVKRGEGAAMMEFPDRIESFLERVCSEVKTGLSIKMRLGMHSAEEILKLVPVLNSFPIKEIAVHARTAVQMYEGEVNIAAFECALKSLTHPVIYNGDIKTKDDFTRIRDAHPDVSGWMIGRGLLIDPFLPMEIKNGLKETDTGRYKRIRQFTEYLLDSYVENLQSSAHVLDKIKGVWVYLAQIFPDSRKTEKRIRKAGSLNHYRDEVSRIFEAIQ